MPGRDIESAMLPEEPEPAQIVEAEFVDVEPAATELAEPAPASSPPFLPDGYTEDGVPTLGYVRQRIASGLGAQELFDQSAPAEDERARQEALRLAAADRLKRLREELP